MLDLQRQIQALADRLPPESKHEIRSTQSETDPEHE
jgi:hypothetical protein